MMYLLKQIPEDFIVQEISDIKPQEQGRYSYWTLTKCDYTTVRAAEHIAAALEISANDIGFAGAKDKKAVTTQLISIKSIAKDRIQKLSLKDITLRFFGYGDAPISLGDLEGNSFTITVRGIDKPPRKIDRMLNLFGDQRFSTNNAAIGKYLVKNKLRYAVELILQGSGDIEAAVGEHLRNKPNDYAGALKRINKKILMLYIHSYQSHIWNRAAQACQGRGIEAKTIPIVGFGTELEAGDAVQRIIRDMMQEDSISERDFIITSLPHLSSEGDERDMYVDIKDLSIGHLEDDELNPGRKRCTLRFMLPRGSYATVAVDQMLSGDYCEDFSR